MEPQDVPSIEVADVPPEAVVVDVREQHEWDAGHAPGALHIPLGELPSRAGEVPQDGPVAVVCHLGGRSARAVAWLQEQGWTSTRNVVGGMEGWARAGRPLVSEDGREPRVV